MNYKARDIAQYAVDRRAMARDTMTPMQVMKIVYLCHGWVLGKLGRPLVRDEFEAWQYGPVSRDLYNAIREYRSSPVLNVKGAACPNLPEDEQLIVDQVVDFYANFDGLRLSALTHSEGSPWEVTWSRFGKNAPISNDTIENYYATLARGQEKEAA